MIRATTPTHTFTFPSGETDIEPSEYDKILITYSQGENIVFEVEKNDLTINGYKVSYTFSQEITNLFRENQDVDIQIRVKKDGVVSASKIFRMPVQKVLNDEVL